MKERLDAVVVGSGPNGLAAAVTLARAGLHVRVYEAADSIGGGARTSELTVPGFRHDVCSAVHPMAFASSFFRAFHLTERVEFAIPEVSYAHPLADGTSGIAYRDLDRTVDGLGGDGRAWRRLMGPLVRHAQDIAGISAGHLLRVPTPLSAAVPLGLAVLEQCTPAWTARFRGSHAPAMLAGLAAHSIQPLPSLAAAASGLVIGAYAHAYGWPIPVGGSQAIPDALAAEVVRLGGEIVVGHPVSSLAELPPARAVLLDVSARALLDLAGDAVPPRYERAVRAFRYGPGAAKVDFALSAPVPWTDPDLALAATLHLGGTQHEVRAAENAVSRGRHAESPFILASQPTGFDASRAPEGAHTLWTYAHVPSGSDVDQRETITRAIERLAPGFRDLIVACSSSTAVDASRYNPNYVGGDIYAGSPSIRQLLKRPVLSTDPWRTPLAGVYLCSSSTPPGPGVHGLCGWNAARSALRREFGIAADPMAAVGLAGDL
ncbi:NAD(P)/FAD-dependent oxidoreductase [Leifsonia lichenia]